MRRKWIVFMVATAASIICIFYLPTLDRLLNLHTALGTVYSPVLCKQGSNEIASTGEEGVRLPKVTVWTDHYGEDLVEILTEATNKCPFKCNFGSREDFNYHYADAIVFHMIDMHHKNLPKDRKIHQIYVSYNVEPPYISSVEMFGIAYPATFFNVTIDYRLSGPTYSCPYGVMREAKTDQEKSLLHSLTDLEISLRIITKKTAPLLAMISNCYTYSKREKYVQELAKYINITFVGDCFDDQPIQAKCPCEGRITCEEQLFEKHYFILALENSVCPDYVTEKFFRLRFNIVPIVLRRRTYKGIAPDDSFIALDDFDGGPRELADHLHKLIENRWAYTTFFNWKKSYILSDVRERKGDQCFGLCDFCRDLHFKNVSTSSNLDIKKQFPYESCESKTAELLLNESRKHSAI